MTGKTITTNPVQTGEWLTIKEASEITGRSINALTILVNRRKIDRIRKVNGKWHIHRDSVINLSGKDRTTGLSSDHDRIDDRMAATGSDRAIPTIPLEHYENKRDEWDRERDRLQTGLMMYRYKFEELEQQVRLLPAPVEIVAKVLVEKEAKVDELQQNLQDKDLALARAQEILDKAREDYDQYKTAIVELKGKLQEEERTKAELRQQLEIELRPWWKKLLGLH